MIRVLQALTATALGNSADALTMLERALAQAEPEGYVRTFVDQGAPMAELLIWTPGADHQELRTRQSS